MQPHMVKCYSFHHCASLTRHDIYGLIRQILEILPTPQVITETAKGKEPRIERASGK